MKNNALTIIFGFLILFSQVSCNSGSNENGNANEDTIKVVVKKTPDIDYSGVYKLSAESACHISITISKDGENFNYQITGDKLDCKGKLVIENQEGETYFTFDGKIADNAPKTVSGKYLDGSIVIQNYGNSMNEYNYFKSCDEKYLEFKK